MSNVVKEVKQKYELLIPTEIKQSIAVKNYENLKIANHPNVSFYKQNMSTFEGKGAFVLLDFGKEICGGIRLFIRETEETAEFHIRLGESITEAMTELGTKNAGNDHSPRDFNVKVSSLSDLTFGQSGFRFAFIELLSNSPVLVQNIFATNNLPDFPLEAKFETSDEELNKIINTAAYTLKLCCQNGYIWDGIKRDRLVWSGDMHQEILTSLYLFGDTVNIRNSLDFVKFDTNKDEWVNWIPSYSAWWIINLCDYCKISNNNEYFTNNIDFAESILAKINSCIDNNGNINIKEAFMDYYLDWPTYESEDAFIGTVSLFIMASKKILEFKENSDAKDIISKLTSILENSKPKSKQAVAFKYLAGAEVDKITDIIEQGGAQGFSTFMTYYLLTADSLAGGENMLKIIKQYYGGMLRCGATTFWEDFSLEWLNGSGRIDEFPVANQKDIHGDFGNHCYLNFRHSLCHGWSSGVIAFIVEHILGIKIEDGKLISINPHLYDLKYIKAEIPIGNKMVKISVDEKNVIVDNI